MAALLVGFQHNAISWNVVVVFEQDDVANLQVLVFNRGVLHLVGLMLKRRNFLASGLVYSIMIVKAIIFLDKLLDCFDSQNKYELNPY